MADGIALENMALTFAKQACAYLADEMGSAVSGWRKLPIPEDSLSLDSLTVISGIGDSSGLAAAFSFSPELADHLFRQTISLMNLSAPDMSPTEQEIYRQATLVEAANVIVGHWLPNYPAKDGRAAMTPPESLERAKQIRYTSNTQLAVIEIATEQGDLRITLIRPRSLIEQEFEAA